MKKLFALLLSLVMVISLLPVTAMALNAPIEEMSVTGTLPQLEVGDTLPDASAAFAVPEGANYTVANAYWWNVTADESAAAGDVVEAYNCYELNISVKVKDGYAFAATDIPLYFNGEDARDIFDGIMPVNDGEPDHNVVEFYLRLDYDFRTVIDRVDISFTEPAVGEAVPVFSIPADANYGFSDEYESGWYEELEWEKVDTIEEGYEYCADVYLLPDENYVFAAEDELQIFINGVDMTDEWYPYITSEDVLNVYGYYSFLKKIDKVELTVPAMEIGDPGFMAEDVTVPEGAKYTVKYVYWYDSGVGYIGEEFTFEKGKSYRYEIELLAADGYTFVEGAPMLVNGEQVDEAGDESNWCYVYGDVSFKTKITAVDLPDVLPETLAVGDSIGTGPIDGEEGYTFVGVTSVYDEEEYEFGIVESGTAEEKVYMMAITAVAADGYEFSEDVVVTMGGEALPYSLITDIGSDYIIYGKLYALGGAQLIDKVEITVDEPQIGKEGGKPSVAEDAPYELDEYFAGWSVADSNDIDEVDALEGVFEEGQYAWLVTSLYAKDGYIFADDVEIYVNGKKVDMEPGVTAMYEGTMMVCANYMGQLVKSAPPTGDNAQLVLWSVLLTVSALGAAWVVSKKRYAK